MKTPIRFLTMLLGLLFLAAGSGQARASAFGPPPSDSIAIAVSSSTLYTQGIVNVTVTVTRANGQPEADGTVVSAVVSPATVGTINASSSTVGGVATFVFTAGNNTGAATLTFSIPPVNRYPKSVSATTTLTVQAAPPDTIKISPQSTSVNVNSSVVVTVAVTRANGTPEADGTPVTGAVLPATGGTVYGVGADGKTSTASVSVTSGGVATFSFTAGTNPSGVTLYFSIPPISGNPSPVSASTALTVLPAPPDTIKISPQSTSVNVNSSVVVTVAVTRANGTPEADGTPVTGAVLPATGGTVYGVGADGKTSTASVSVTSGGVATFSFTAGTNPSGVTLYFSIPPISGNPSPVSASTALTVLPAPPDTIRVSPPASTINANSMAVMTVSVSRPNGASEADGTAVTASVSPATAGTIYSVGTGGKLNSNGVGLTAGGVATFTFVAGNNPGSAAITFSIGPINGNPSGVSTTAAITVVAGSGNNSSLQIGPSSVILPQNIKGYGPALGSPYLAELQVQWRGLVSGTPLNGKVNVAVTPVEVATFSMLDDPTTPWVGQTKTPPTAEGNEFLTELGSGQVPVTAGVGTIFVLAGDQAGTATLTITAQDPETNQTINSQITITVLPPAQLPPASVNLSQGSGGLYVNGSNGPGAKLLTAQVIDIAGNPMTNPPSGVNNVRFQIVGPAGSDAILYGLDATGKLVSGSSIDTSTYGGLANVSILAGSVQGPVQVSATTDAADGNVSNGIGKPISAQTTVIISDGRLYSLTIASPIVNAIAVNGITPSSSSSSSSSTAPTIPLKPDATYTLTVSAIANDRQGNPVLPGTAIRFGLIDSPQATAPSFGGACNGGLGAFQICGWNGHPQPGTVLFSAPDGSFRSAGGGAGPGDTLVVFGKQEHGAPAGNDDLESALTVTGVLGDKQLFTLFPFNLNDTTGTSTPSGALPYIIGRATSGNINSPAMTDSGNTSTFTGTATTTLNYPISKLNRSVVIWAQGVGPDTASGGLRNVTDAVVSVYPALADLSVSASPNPITGNITQPVTVCIIDALRVPIPGMRFNFGFSNLGVGSGMVDGIANSGWTQNVTDASGCVVANVSTTGIAGGSNSSASSAPTLTFTAAGYAPGSKASVAIPIVAGGNLILMASPSALGGSGGGVTLTLLSSNGLPVPGVQLTGTCTGDTVSLASIPGTTNTSGQTTATITANLDAYGTPGTGTCTFTTATGSPTAIVNLKGTNLCLADPTNSKCTTSSGGGGTGTGSNSITITVDATSATLPGGFATVSLSGAVFSPSSGGCRADATTTPTPYFKTCTYTVAQSVTSVTLTAAPSTSVTWTGACTGSGSPIVVPISGATVCTAKFN